MIELLIAGLLSAVVLLVVYLVFITNSAQYYRQEQIVQMQESMRFALEYLKNDLRNAGRLSPTHGNDGRMCARRDLIAVRVCQTDNDTLAVLTANGNERRPDRIRLMTDAGDAAMLRTVRVAPDRIVLAPADGQPTVVSRALASSQARMESAFDGAWVAVSLPGAAAAMDVVRVNGIAFNAGGTTLQLGASPCENPNSPLATCGGECLVSPLQVVEYGVAIEDGTDTPRLLRRVLSNRADPTNCAITQTVGDPVVMADLVVEMRLGGLFAVAGQRELVREDIPDSPEVARLRAFELTLGVRTPREDPEFTVAMQRQGERDAPDRNWFELDPTPDTGLARVTTATATVDAVNLVPEQ